MELASSFPDTLEEISKYIFTAKYARYNKDLGRRETWSEAVDRVKMMHLNHFDKLTEDQIEEIDWAFKMVEQKKVAPSMRSMQFGGTAIETCHIRSFNCAVRHIDSIRAFAEVFYLLMCGCGVGLGLMPKFTNRLPKLVGPDDKTGTVTVYTIEDSKEGWSDSIEALLQCYFVNTAFSGRRIVFDYSKIRAKGSPLVTSGGKAPGYEPLKNAHAKIKGLLDDRIENMGLQRLRSIDIYDILMHVSDAVLSGGIRRSATLTIFDINDELMLNAKTGNWFEENPQRARSNNSALLLRDRTTREQFAKIVANAREFGEPGFFWADNEDAICNPCAEIGFVPVTSDGRCGVQVCNLTSINGAKIETFEDFKEAAKAAAIIGTLQAAYTDFPYLSDVAKELTEEEALLGVSITAMMDNIDVLFDPWAQKQAAREVVLTNERWASILGIRPAARPTAIKPEGTWTLVGGSMSHGIHAAHSRRMFRRVQANKNENVYNFFKAWNPDLCEPSVYSANQTDDIITFPIQLDEKVVVKDDLTAIEHLDMIRSTQQNWVLSASKYHNTKNVEHNVSCTVIVDNHEWDDVTNYIYDYRYDFTAISLLSKSGDKDYAQAPQEAVVTPEDEEKFQRLMNSFMALDYTLLEESQDNTTLEQTAACSGGACEII